MKVLLLILVIIAPLWVFSQSTSSKSTPAENVRPNQIVEYRVFEGSRSAELSQRVKEALGAGWEPFGTLAVIENPANISEPRFYQAMIKRGN